MGELYVSAVEEGTTHHAIVRWHATTGWEVKDSKVLIDDQGNITQPGGATIQGKDVSTALLATDDPLVIPASAINLTHPVLCTINFKGADANILTDSATLRIGPDEHLELVAGSGNELSLQTKKPGTVVICQSGQQCTVQGKFKVDSTGVIDWDGSTLTFITPTIASMTNAQHDHADAAGGGTLNASAIAAGTVALARGGTNADLSATGGTSEVLQQASGGANITVGQLAASNLSNGTTGSGAVVLTSSPTLVLPTIASFTNALHDHANAGGGGALAKSAYSQEAHIDLVSQTTALVF